MTESRCTIVETVGATGVLRSGERVQWLVLLRHRSAVIGLDSRCRWVQQAGESLVEPHEAGFTYTFPLLEVPLEQVLSELRQNLDKYGLTQLSEDFPATAIAVAALAAQPYWANLALDWVEALPSSGLILAALGDLARSNRSAAPQKLRHRARRILRERQREQGARQ